MQKETQSEQPQSKPKFSSQPDPSQQKITTILSTIHKQQQQILQLLNKYKKAIPEAQYNDQDRNSLNRSAFVKVQEESKKDSGKYNGRLGIKSGSKTIPVNKLSSSVAKDKYSEYIAYGDGKRLDKSKFQNYLGEARKNIKLPSVYNRANNKKQEIQIEYQKADKKYNENVIKFYEQLSARKEDSTKITKKDVIIRSKQKSIPKKHRKIQSSLILNPPAEIRTQPAKLNLKKFENIFDPDELNQAQNLIGMQHQIAKPISSKPYSDMLQYQQLKNAPKQSRANSKIQDDEDKPVQVSMTYYIRNFNQKWKEQCQQQINYLYFSKGDQEDSNKQWAEEVIKMFERHDSDLGKFHHNMRYLETFDEAFFTAGIYQGSQANKKGY